MLSAGFVLLNLHQLARQFHKAGLIHQGQAENPTCYDKTCTVIIVFKCNYMFKLSRMSMAEYAPVMANKQLFLPLQEAKILQLVLVPLTSLNHVCVLSQL